MSATPTAIKANENKSAQAEPEPDENEGQTHQQHDEIRHGKRAHVQKRPDCLLQHIRSELARGVSGLSPANPTGRHQTARLPRPTGAALAVGRRGRGRGAGSSGRFRLVSAEEIAVVFLGSAAEGLQHHDEEDDADAGTAEHAGGGDVPGGGYEAWNSRGRVRI